MHAADAVQEGVGGGVIVSKVPGTGRAGARQAIQAGVGGAARGGGGRRRRAAGRAAGLACAQPGRGGRRGRAAHRRPGRRARRSCSGARREGLRRFRRRTPGAAGRCRAEEAAGVAGAGAAPEAQHILPRTLSDERCDAEKSNRSGMTERCACDMKGRGVRHWGRGAGTSPSPHGRARGRRLCRRARLSRRPRRRGDGAAVGGAVAGGAAAQRSARAAAGAGGAGRAGRGRRGRVRRQPGRAPGVAGRGVRAGAAAPAARPLAGTPPVFPLTCCVALSAWAEPCRSLQLRAHNLTAPVSVKA